MSVKSFTSAPRNAYDTQYCEIQEFFDLSRNRYDSKPEYQIHLSMYKFPPHHTPLNTPPPHCKLTNKPPSTKSPLPFTYPLNSSLAKKTAGPAKSRGTPVLPNGIRPSIYDLFSSSFKSSSFNCVLIVPGKSALHLIPYFPSAHAILCMRERTPALVGV